MKWLKNMVLVLVLLLALAGACLTPYLMAEFWIKPWFIQQRMYLFHT